MQIAQSTQVPLRTVHSLIRRFREQGEDGIATSYCTEGSKLSPQRKKLRQAAEHLRREHAGWGSTIIHIMLGKQPGGEHLPTPRTIRRWLAESGLGPAPRGQKPAGKSSRAAQAHDVWQMDASEDIKLGNGQRVSWLRITDEHTGAVLTTFVFSRGPL